MHNRQEISIIPSKDFGFHLIFNYAGAKHCTSYSIYYCAQKCTLKSFITDFINQGNSR